MKLRLHFQRLDKGTMVFGTVCVTGKSELYGIWPLHQNCFTVQQQSWRLYLHMQTQRNISIHMKLHFYVYASAEGYGGSSLATCSTKYMCWFLTMSACLGLHADLLRTHFSLEIPITVVGSVYHQLQSSTSNPGIIHSVARWSNSYGSVAFGLGWRHTEFPCIQSRTAQS